MKATRLRISINDGMDFIGKLSIQGEAGNVKEILNCCGTAFLLSFPLAKWCCEIVFGPYCGVYGRVGLLAFSFQFFTRLCAVFAEEIGDFGMSFGHIQRCSTMIILRIHILTIGDE